MLKTIFDNGKVLKLPCVKTLLKIQDNVSFQNVKFNFVEKAKITICNNAVIWTDKVTGCVSVPRCVCVCVCLRLLTVKASSVCINWGSPMLC